MVNIIIFLLKSYFFQVISIILKFNELIKLNDLLKEFNCVFRN